MGTGALNYFPIFFPYFAIFGREAQGSNPTDYASNGAGSNGNGSNGNGSNSNGNRLAGSSYLYWLIYSCLKHSCNNCSLIHIIFMSTDFLVITT